MSGQTPFSWRDGEGWLVLSGGAHPLSEIRARALSRCDPFADIACIAQTDEMGDALMDDLADLGAPTGYHIDLTEPDNNQLYARITSAGLIVIAADCADSLRSALRQTAVHALKRALAGGTLLLCEGAAAGLFGEHRWTAGDGLTRGLNFVSGAVILPAGDESSDYAAWQAQSSLQEVACISLARGSALALGPDRNLETWGERDVTIRLSALQPPGLARAEAG
ncbi:MAG: hypothetical protein OXE95_10270 [Chloroflexi bacterium]|nr:hypothetical protein [Chloroflexota bacterium]MCY4247944.1 hypothetical protein [Chloroflexota bacterium]